VFVIVMLIDAIIVKKETNVSAIILPILAVIISAVPVALPMVITVTLAIGAQKMSKEGAIVTNLGALQEIASMDVLCSDKTGTLTTAVMSVYADRIFVNPACNCTVDDVLMWSALCSNRDNVDDPIDRAVLQAYGTNSVTVVALSLQGCHTVVTLLLHCCCKVVTLLLQHCRYSPTP
jgi:H+-transporting ATPase